MTPRPTAAATRRRHVIAYLLVLAVTVTASMIVVLRSGGEPLAALGALPLLAVASAGCLAVLAHWERTDRRRHHREVVAAPADAARPAAPCPQPVQRRHAEPLSEPHPLGGEAA